MRLGKVEHIKDLWDSKMNEHKGTPNLTAEAVLRRYKDEELPEFSEIALEDVNQAGNFGDRPLHVACIRGNLEEIAALLEGGADVNAAGELGNRPLHEAVSQGHLTAVQFLLDHGASVHETNDEQMTALDIARLRGRHDITEVLKA
jgi:ankyrin repeat protein